MKHEWIIKDLVLRLSLRVFIVVLLAGIYHYVCVHRKRSNPSRTCSVMCVYPREMLLQLRPPDASATQCPPSLVTLRVRWTGGARTVLPRRVYRRVSNVE
ncbi:unnamed protein product [Vitrella brassicaformis CCMP3155]|uniref:Uncharacterized protein n=1 Tax=Vitrella brassicaformis (strain CCMP3155) TaxID=1169540 RepID=A0A0G4ES22_VITBC|nr:unnamed protein product [Vitrella brassicaformis CCMP3155]|eukprot:CEM00849.1 unnamed protein product [Vitrella brassicaformis CCMP3155]